MTPQYPFALFSKVCEARYDLLKNEPLTLAEFTEEAKISKRTAIRWLKTLMEVGKVIRIETASKRKTYMYFATAEKLNPSNAEIQKFHKTFRYNDPSGNRPSDETIREEGFDPRFVYWNRETEGWESVK